MSHWHFFSYISEMRLKHLEKLRQVELWSLKHMLLNIQKHFNDINNIEIRRITRLQTTRNQFCRRKEILKFQKNWYCFPDFISHKILVLVFGCPYFTSHFIMVRFRCRGISVGIILITIYFKNLTISGIFFAKNFPSRWLHLFANSTLSTAFPRVEYSPLLMGNLKI